MIRLWQRWTYAPTSSYCHHLRHAFTTHICGNLNGKNYRIKTTVGWYYAEKAKTA